MSSYDKYRFIPGYNAVYTHAGVAIFVVLVLHELIHGFFFWLFSRQKPIFGFNNLTRLVFSKKSVTGYWKRSININ